MKQVLQLPCTKEDIKKLHAGDSILLNGVIYTARDAAHKRLHEMLENNQPLPFDLNHASIYYVGPSPASRDFPLGSAGPTTSSRCDYYTPLLVENGLQVMIGKGIRNSEVKKSLIKHCAVYLAAIGGAGALLSRCIKSAEVIAFDDLGTEAIRKLEIENFPAIVINDCHGNDYYETARLNYLQSIKK